MMTKTRALLAALGLLCTQALWAQTISDPVALIRAMSDAEVDANMTGIAQHITASAPVQADAVTTIARAVYLPTLKTLNYVVRLSESVPASTAAKRMGESLCKGRTNLAFMDRGVTYQYSVTTPSQTYSISFKRGDCQ